MTNVCWKMKIEISVKPRTPQKVSENPLVFPKSLTLLQTCRGDGTALPEEQLGDH